VRPTLTTEELEPSGYENEIRNVQQWVRDLMRQDEIETDMKSGRLRMGFVAFSKRARIRQSLTDEPTRITSAVGRMRSGEITKIDQGLREAERILFGSGGRYQEGEENRIKVILVLSDFQFCQRDIRIGGRLRNEVVIVTQGFGVRNYDRPKVRDIASESKFAFERASVQGFMDIYNDDLGTSRPVGLETLHVKDELQENMRLIPGSADPPTVTITGRLMEWEILQPTLPMTLGYTIQPLEAGTHPVSVEASAAYTDTEGLPGGGPFPDVSVEVAPPTPTPTSTNTPTPTATATNTPTATPTPGPKYMPIAYRNWPEPTPTPEATECIPEEQVVDLALVIDTSTSMGDPTSEGGQPKLEAAIEAAEELVALLKPEDQVAVIGFNRASHLATQLTGDKARVRWALSTLPGTQAQGTSIDLGLAEALAELESPRHKQGNDRSIVLVTDGRQTGLGGNAAVRAVAQQIHAADIKLITVGLGSDVDEALLRDIASSPELYFPAPNAEELKDIYREIARVIPG
jgi:Mg-chelatase subunit ChlD